MSDQYYDEDEYVDDPFERQSGGGGAPVVSWKFVRAGGDKFTGIVLPPVVTGPKAATDKGYEMRKDWQAGTDEDPDDKGYLVWPPRGNTEGYKRPVTEMKHQKIWPHIDITARHPDGKPVVRKVWRTNVTFHTNYAAAEFISEKAAKRMVEQEKDPNAETLRRIILNSKDLETKLAAAFKAIGTDRPRPGQTWTIGIQAREDNVGRQGSTTIYSVDVKAPTPETMAVVKAYIDAEQNKAAETEAKADPSDPWAAGSTQGEPPPF